MHVGGFGKGVRCSVVNGPAFPVLFASRQWLQVGWLLEPAHSCHLSSQLPVKYIFCFTGRMHGWINC